jgi:hypothetical protein
MVGNCSGRWEFHHVSRGEPTEFLGANPTTCGKLRLLIIGARNLSVAILAIWLRLQWRVADGVVAGIDRQVPALQCFLPAQIRPTVLPPRSPIKPPPTSPFRVIAEIGNQGQEWVRHRSTTRLKSAAHDLLKGWSGRWESNPPSRLGKPVHYHYATPAFRKNAWPGPDFKNRSRFLVEA